jgi:predicted TIM-barrel fold metal-dependent hydrolase
VEKEQLLPYLPRIWQRYVTQKAGLFPGTQTPNLWPYAGPSPGGGRLDWVEDDKSSATRLEVMQRHLFDEEKVTIAILNGSFYPSDMVGNYEFAQALASAYNDWQIEHWLEPEPRLRGSVHIVAKEPAQAVREIERAGKHPQMVQVHLPTATYCEYGDPFYRPIFEAAVENDLAVSFHHSRRTETVLGYPRYYVEWHSMAAPQAAMNQILSLICNGLFDEMPDLRTVFLETGVGWVPWFLSRLDQQYREVRVEVPWVKKLPSEHMRNNVRLATQPLNDVSPRDFANLVETYSLERVYVFATDYPHYDADNADTALPSTFPDELRERIRYKNALDTYPRLRAELAT